MPKTRGNLTSETYRRCALPCEFNPPLFLLHFLWQKNCHSILFGAIAESQQIHRSKC